MMTVKSDDDDECYVMLMVSLNGFAVFVFMKVMNNKWQICAGVAQRLLVSAIQMLRNLGQWCRNTT